MQKLIAWWAVLGAGTAGMVATLFATQWLAWNGPEWLAVERAAHGPIKHGFGLVFSCAVVLLALLVGTIGGLATVSVESKRR